jgi:hypothetical protein
MVGERQEAFAKRPSDHLVHRVVPADVLARTQELASCAEQTGCVQASRQRKGSLRRAQTVRQLPDQRDRRAQVALDTRRLDGDRLESALAAHSARRGGVEVPLESGGVEAVRGDVDRVGGQVRGRARVRRAYPFRDEKAERELLVVPRRAHRHGNGATVDADLEGLLDGELVPLLHAGRVANHLDGRRRIRWHRAHPHQA